jgi:hypothetical protein
VTPSQATSLYGAHLFTTEQDRSTWTTLSQGALATNTWASYDAKFHKFHDFCDTHGLRSLPASTATVLRYILYLFREDRVHGSSLQPYLSAINRVHRDLNLPAPADGHLVNTARRGFTRLHTQAAAPRPGEVTAPTRAQRSPVPAQLVMRAVQHGLHTTDAFVRTCCAIVVHAFLFAARASSVIGVPVSAYAFEADGSLTFREDMRKTGGPSRVLRVPLLGSPEQHPLALLRRHYARRLQSATQHDVNPAQVALFFHRDLPVTSPSAMISHALTTVLRAIDCTVPSGVPYTSHSLRSGAATAAIASGAPLPTVMAWCGWRSLSSAQRYIDPTVRSSPATDLFFSFLRPSSSPSNAPFGHISNV